MRHYPHTCRAYQNTFPETTLPDIPISPCRYLTARPAIRTLSSCSVPCIVKLSWQLTVQNLLLSRRVDQYRTRKQCGEPQTGSSSTPAFGVKYRKRNRPVLPERSQSRLVHPVPEVTQMWKRTIELNMEASRPSLKQPGCLDAPFMPD